MNREEFKKIFGCAGPAVFPVIHVLDHAQTVRNIEICVNHDVQGVFLINHDFDVEAFLPIIRSVRIDFPDIWMGLNFLAVTGKDAFPVLANLEKQGHRIDGYWADDARIDENRRVDDQSEAAEILGVKNNCSWNGLYFGGTAFKKQRFVEEGDYLHSADIASQWMDVVTTSGVATAKEAGVDKIDTFRNGVGDTALGLASGVTPDNVIEYKEHVDAILVATGINIFEDFYNIDLTRLNRLLENV